MSYMNIKLSCRRNWTQFNDGSFKLFSMTSLTMTPVPFLGRQEQCQKLFQKLACSTDNCLHCLLPSMRDPTITNSLRHANKYPPIFAKTTKIHLFVTDFHIIS